MKKNILLVIVLTFTGYTTIAQNAFYGSQYLATIDAKVLDKIKETDSDRDKYVSISENEMSQIKNLKEFLKTPFSKKITPIDFELIKSAIEKQNKYLTVINEAQNEFSMERMLPASGIGFSFIPQLLNGSLSLSKEQQSNIIDGLTKYYAEEFKKAQTITYLKTIESTADKVGELKIFFPKTLEKIRNSDPSKFPDLGNEFKDIFNEDMKSIVDNLLNYIESYPEGSLPDNKLFFLKAKYVSEIKFSKHYKPLLLTADVSSKLLQNYNPVDLLNYVDQKYYTPNTTAPADLEFIDKLYFAAHGINIIQFNLRDTAKSKTDKYWINFEDLKQLNTENELKYFVGLIYQQDREYFDRLFINLDLKKSEGQAKIIKQYIQSVLETLLAIQEFHKNHSGDKFRDNIEIYLQFYTDILTKIPIAGEQLSKNADFKKFLTISKPILNMYAELSKKNYSNTIFNLTLILNEFLGENADFQNALTKLNEYGGFMADVINAKNSDEVKESIKKFAAPPASYIQKRSFRYTLSITGQPGYFAGTEILKKDEKWAFVSGITLPMGFEYTVKLKHGQQNSGSFGVFAQLIDLGAILNFRIDDETSELPDKIEFKQIFSPGGSLNYGFKDSPANISIGYQYTPELREVTSESTVNYSKGHRIFIRLAWDIPFLNICKSKRK